MEEPKRPLIPFEPVPVRHRNDGWRVEKQYVFIQALAEDRIVEHACRRAKPPRPRQRPTSAGRSRVERIPRGWRWPTGLR